MKYYLVIGYCLFEKNVDWPTIKVYVNNTLVDEFTCDNDRTTKITSHNAIREQNEGRYGYNATYTQEFTSKFSTTKKHKVIEVDTSSWPDTGQLKIEVAGNKSNYNNGFMSKKSMVALQPIYLIPKDLLHDEETMKRIFLKMSNNQERIYIEKSQPKEIDSLTRTIWPGFTLYQAPSLDSVYGQKKVKEELICGGGDFTLNFDIIKKHKIFMLTKDRWKKKGYLFTDSFFHAWYQHFTKKYFNLVVYQNFDREGITRSRYVKLEEINTSNED